MRPSPAPADPAPPLVAVLAAMRDADRSLDALESVEAWSPVTSVQIRYLFPDLLADVRSHPRFSAIQAHLDAAWRQPLSV